MNDVITLLINKLPSWYLEVLIPILLIAGVWVCSHIRRDKQGKLYWFRTSYENRKQGTKLDKILEVVNKIEMRVDRLELLNLIEHHPEQKEIVLNKYDEYKREGGNSYMDEVVSEYKRTF
jgi:hypothetical protein